MRSTASPHGRASGEVGCSECLTHGSDGEMDLLDLRIFARVAAVQNLSAVGAELDVTPGTISKRLQALEDELSVMLFERTTRSIRITPEGETFLSHVRRILDEMDSANAQLGDSAGQAAGRLRIAAPSSIARKLVAPAIASFMASYPLIEVRLDLTDRVVNLMDEAYDAIIVSGQLSDSTLIARRLAADRHVLAAAPAYLAKNGTPRVPADLEHHECLSAGQGRFWQLRRDQVEQSIRAQGRLQSDDGDLLRWAAISGTGILRSSVLNVSRDLAKGRLVEVLPEFEVVTKSAIWIVYAKTRHVMPRLRVLIDHMVTWSRDHLDTGNSTDSELIAAK